jgi:hypothetical protein
MDNLNETHRNITRIMEEQQRGSVAMGHLATSNATLHDQLSLTRANLKELADNKDAHCAQMADHRQRMDALNLIIQQVGDCIMSTVNQNLLLNAQMKEICTTIKTAANAIQNDINDLCGRIIPDLRSALASLKSKVSELHDLSVSLKSEVLDLQEKVTTIKDIIPATSPDPTPPASDETTCSLQPDGTQTPRETTSHPTPGEQPRPPTGVVPAGGDSTDTRPPPNHWGHHHHPADNHPPQVLSMVAIPVLPIGMTHRGITKTTAIVASMIHPEAAMASMDPPPDAITMAITSPTMPDLANVGSKLLTGLDQATIPTGIVVPANP